MTYLLIVALVLGLAGTITGCISLYVLAGVANVVHDAAEKRRKP